MKQCWSVGELRAYLDRELPDEEMSQVAEHLEVCSECGDQWTELAGRAARVSSLMDALAIPEHVVSIAGRPRRVSRAKWLWAGAAAALAAGLVLGLVAMPKHQTPIAVARPPAPVMRTTPDPVEPATPRMVSARASAAVSESAPAARVRAPQPMRRHLSPQARALDDFVALDDEQINTGVVLRVELGPKGIPADVIFGPDGRPHAIRLVDNKTKY